MAEALTLHFPDHVRVAGELLQGQVDVNVPMALADKMESVKIKLRGSIVTKITETEHHAGGENETHYQHQTVELVRADETLWDQFNTPQGVQVLSCPFRLQLPPNLPPSFHHSQFNRKVAITYSLEVVGVRHGLLHANRRVRKIFSVVPAASAWELNASAALRQGWGGPWKPIATNKEIRHGVLFGEHSQAKMELVIPDLPSLPMGIGIPFSFHVLTHTKPVQRSELERKHGKLFPTPPASPAEVEVVLYRRGHIRVRHKSEEIEEKFALQGSLGDKASVEAVRTTVDEPEFTDTPDHKDKGIWKRAVHFEGMFTFPYTPTFSAENAECTYSLRIKVDFHGIGNHLELDFPVHIDSGAAVPPPYPFNAAYPLSVGPPPMLSLPSAYWKGDDHEWDEEE
ncbi:hypothetical protein DFH07DRAFT_803338 [Mycena maculata]|uniref:Arrestin-like N-terminal domain-containing protein n=1 Tax=Mycena maculata TaxID=230809 RepID=A0AAD7NRC0_9AGAR|nr:hypothetical protein DFH07DRAFT_803338 [Mycena maculata]